MKSRMEKYSESMDTPKRTDRNSSLYDEIYTQRKEPESNVTVIDNVNEIDINKIKEMISNREDYKKLRQYQSITNDSKEDNKLNTRYDLDEIDSKNYDINEIIEKKKSNQNSEFDEDKIRKISNTQYDILKDLNVNSEHNEEISNEEKEDQLKELINTIVKEKGELSTFAKTNLDFFADLREETDEENTTAIIKEENLKLDDIEKKDNEFFASDDSFKKEDFEEDLSKPKEKGNLIFKITIGILVALILLVLVFIILIL